MLKQTSKQHCISTRLLSQVLYGGGSLFVRNQTKDVEIDENAACDEEVYFRVAHTSYAFRWSFECSHEGRGELEEFLTLVLVALLECTGFCL